MRKFLPGCALLGLLAACSGANERTSPGTPAPGESRLSLTTRIAGGGRSDADKIRELAIYLVAPASGTFIKQVHARVSEDGTSGSAVATIPAAYAGQEICAYFIANPAALSDPLDMAPESGFDLSRLDRLATRAPLGGDSPRYVLSAKSSFRANGPDISAQGIELERTFAKIYLCPAAEMSPEQQRELEVVSVEVVNGSGAGYLFRDEVFPEQASSRRVSIGQTIDRVDPDLPVCCLYPDNGQAEGSSLAVTLRNTTDGRVVSKQVSVAFQRNTSHRVTIQALPEADGGYAVQVSDWDEQLLLPEAGGDVHASLLPDEGIDLANAPEAFYYYNQLQPAEQELYRCVFDKANNFTETLSPGERLIVPLPDRLQGKFTKDGFLKVTGYLLNDMAVLFNTGTITQYGMDSGGKVVSYRMSLYAMRPLFDIRAGLAVRAAGEFLARIPSGLSEFDRVKTVHDLFLKGVSYGGMNSPLAGNIAGGLVNKKVVCEGYARTFQYLLQRAGIQALFVGGQVMSSGTWIEHAWNIVRVEGKYYFTDPTWDDAPIPDPELLHHTYFLKSKTYMDQTHRLKAELPIPECPEDYPLPKL